MIWDEIPEREWSDMENEENEIDRTKALLTQDASYFIDSITQNQKAANDNEEKLICDAVENNKSDNISETDNSRYENLNDIKNQSLNSKVKHDLDVSRELEVLSLDNANMIGEEPASGIPHCINLSIEHETLLSPPDDFLATQIRNEKSKRRLMLTNPANVQNQISSSGIHCNNDSAADYSDISVQWMNRTSLVTSRTEPDQSQTVKNARPFNEASPNKNEIINYNNIANGLSSKASKIKSLIISQAPENNNSNSCKHGAAADDTNLNVYSTVLSRKSPPIRLEDEIKTDISEIVLKARLNNIHTNETYISDEDLDESINALENISAFDFDANDNAAHKSSVNNATSTAKSTKTMKTVGVQTVLSSVNIQFRNRMESRKRDLDALHLEVPKDEISFGQYCSCGRHKVNISDLRKKVKKENRCSDNLGLNSTIHLDKPRVRIGLSRKGKFKPLHRRNFN